MNRMMSSALPDKMFSVITTAVLATLALVAATAWIWLKCVAVLSHLRFALDHGNDFTQALEVERTARIASMSSTGSIPTFSWQELQDLLTTPDFRSRDLLVFGYKEVKLRILAARLADSQAVVRRAGALGVTLMRTAFDASGVVILTGVVAVWSGIQFETSSAVDRILGVLVVVGLQTLAAMLCLEATINYVKSGSYGGVPQAPLKFANDQLPSSFIVEVRTLVGLALAVVLVDSICLSFMANAIAADWKDLDLTGVHELFSCVFHVAMTFIFSTQLQPTDFWGQIAVLVISLHAVLVVLIGVAALTGSTQVRSS